MLSSLLILGLLAASPTGQEPFDLEAALQKGLRAYEKRDFEEAKRVWVEGAEEARKAGDDLFLGSFLGNLAIAYTMTREYETAVVHYLRSLEVAVKANDRSGEKNRRNNLAGLYLLTGQPAEALAQLDAAIPIAEDSGDAALVIRIQCNAAQALAALGERKEAEARLTAAEKRLGEAELPRDVAAKLKEAIGRARAAVTGPAR